MTQNEIEKYGEIQYLKGRLDELYKSYSPGNPSHTNRVVDARISKYEKKLKDLDEVSFHLYQVERKNIRFSKQKSKETIISLLSNIKEKLIDLKDENLIKEIELQLETYN